DVVLACVRYEQLAALPTKLGESRAPVVVLTPMMPRDHKLLDAALGQRLIAGMPSVIAYRNDAGVVRYWLPRLASTWIEARGGEGRRGDALRRGAFRPEARRAEHRAGRGSARSGAGARGAPDGAGGPGSTGPISGGAGVMSRPGARPMRVLPQLEPRRNAL